MLTRHSFGLMYYKMCRCGIPVVIMGETGCGKTRLIRYMCDLKKQGADTDNMLIMKVYSHFMLQVLISLCS